MTEVDARRHRLGRGEHGPRNPRSRRAGLSDINLLRYVPVDSPVHRLWAGTKILSLVAVGIAITLRPNWSGLGLVTGLVVLTALVSRVPFGAVPRFPRWFWIGIALTSISAFFAGGHPELHIGGVKIGLGGLDKWSRFTVLVLVLLSVTMVIGWTTRNGEVAPALSTLLSPLRLLRIPTDEAAVVTALGVRCMPLLLDEIRTLYAARKLRAPEPPETIRAALAEVNDLLVTALVSSARRAQEMADAIEARGGVGTVVPSRPLLALSEFVALGLTAAVVVGVLVL